ncbi:MAG: murein hydrolase activator EnvC family protein [Fibrobacterota bacterium]|nr:peptidoglycan DD-metalloendopeptidase family protein [Chitinispirillaceae bacterium]
MDRKYECGTKIPCLILLLLCCFFNVTAQRGQGDGTQFDKELKQKAGVLDSIKDELKKGRQKLAELEAQEGNAQEKIIQIEKNIEASRVYLYLLTSKIDSVEKQIGVLRDSVSAAGLRLIDRQKIMEKRLRQAYMSGSPNMVMMLLSSASPADFINKTKYIQELKQYDSHLMHQIGNARDAFDNRKSSYQDEKIRLDQLVSAKKQEHETLIKEEDKRKAMLDGVRNQKKSWENTVAELERTQRELNSIIKLLEEKRKKLKQVEVRKGLSFDKRKGKLGWPIDGKISAKFGKIVHPVYKTVTMNNGVDIKSSVPGGAVTVVAAGTVIHTGAMRGLGKLVIVDHNNGFLTIYANLTEISVKNDQEVADGAIVGKIGSTAKDSSLHFEIRRSGETLDPQDWLE